MIMSHIHNYHYYNEIALLLSLALRCGPVFPLLKVRSMAWPLAFSLAQAERAWRHVFVRDLTLLARVGVYPAERDCEQPIRVSLDMAVCETKPDLGDDLANVVCYENIANGVRAVVGAGHVNLVETLAERIAAAVLADARVRRVRVRVEKPAAIPGAAAAGVEIERLSPR